MGPTPPSAMASRSGNASATSCHKVSTTERRRVNACLTSVGSDSDNNASRPEAVAVGVVVAVAVVVDPLANDDAERGIAISVVIVNESMGGG